MAKRMTWFLLARFLEEDQSRYEEGRTNRDE
jgi:hypothetical protein